MNIPNLLTLVRIFFVPLLVAALVQENWFTLRIHGVVITNEWLALAIFWVAAFTDLLAGHIAMVAGSPVELKPYLDSGKLKPLAVLDTKRSPHLPNVPIVTDTLKDCPPAVTYNGLLGPAHLPKEVVDTLSRELVAAGKSEEFRQRLLNVGPEPLLNSPEDFAKVIAADSAQWNGIMPGLNLKQQ